MASPLRSKKFLEYADSFEKDFLKHGVPEDIFLNVLNFELSIDKTIKYHNYTLNKISVRSFKFSSGKTSVFNN